MALIHFLSLGCDKNLSDSEYMMGLLAEAGHVFTHRPEEAELIIVNTCAFIGDAKQESIEAILDLARHKGAGACRGLIATGCLAQRYRDQILKEMPELDGVLGTSAYHHILQAAETLLKGQGPVSCFEDLSLLPQVRPRILSTGGHYAYLKIAEGCSKHCSYCAIPAARGPFRSYPEEYLLEQAQVLAEQGARELILVAQETTLYGTDLYGKKTLSRLIRRLEEIPSLKWIRLLYTYPEEVDPALMEQLAAGGKLLPYLDMPVQHASDSILKAMGRRTSRKELEEIIRRLRENVPELVLRTTLLTGFPGETEKDHRINLDFVKQNAFDRLGVFCYSREEGTAAYSMKGQVHPGTKKRRRKELMLAQQEIAFEKARRLKGRCLTVMVEGRLSEEGTYVARTGGDAPEVDGLLFFEDEKEWESGDFLEVRVIAARGYDLIGEAKHESSE